MRPLISVLYLKQVEGGGRRSIFMPMTNEEILKKAIEKVAEYGYDQGVANHYIRNIKDVGVCDLIFSRDFARAFARAFARYIQADKRNGGNLDEKLGCLFSYWWHDANGHQPRPDEELDMIMNDFLIDLALERDKFKYLAQFL